MAEGLHFAHGVGEDFGGEFDVDRDFVERAGTGQLDVEVRRESGDAEERLLDLRGEDVDAADDEHVVRAARDAGHAGRGAAARAGFVCDARDVARAVAEERRGFAREGGEDEFAGGAFGHGLERVGVNDFDEEVVVLDVHAGLAGAVAGDAGADDFGEAVVVGGGDGEGLFDVAAHVLGPGFAAEEGEGEFEFGLEAALADGLDEFEGVGGRGDEGVDAHVLEDHELLFGVAGGDGDDARADAFDAVVEAEAAGEESVPERDLRGVVGPQSARDEEPRAEVGPQAEVGAGVRDERGFAGGAGGTVVPDDLLLRHGEHPDRVVVAQVGLDRERQGRELPERRDGFGPDARGVEGVAVKRHVAVKPSHKFFKPRELQRGALGGRHALELRLPDGGGVGGGFHEEKLKI